jgi:hypothetical protein
MVNVILLGALSTRLPALAEADWEAAIAARFAKPKVREAVGAAFLKGVAACPAP